MTKTDTPNIHRMPHDKDHPYHCISRDLSQNGELSFAARGMMAYILSKPDTWEINLDDLQQQCGRDAARSILEELIKHGYIERGKQTRVKGRFSTSTPYQCYESPRTEKPLTAQPSTDKPRTGQPRTENPTEESKEVKKVKNKKVKKKEKVEKETDSVFSHRNKTDIIKAWLDNLPAQPLDEDNPYNKKPYIKIAEKILGKGHTVEDVSRYVKAECSGFYKDKKLPFGKVLSNLPAWLTANPAPKPVEVIEPYIPTEEDLALIERHNTQLQELYDEYMPEHWKAAMQS